MKYAKIMLGGLVAFATTANAMPTQEQTKKVEPLVQDLMKDDQVALKSGKKTRVEVAQSAMELADKADSEAAKLLLMKGAFNLYVRAGEFDKAIETLQGLQAAIPDLPPANMAGIIESSLRVVSRKNGGQLYRLLDETKTRMRYTTAAKSLEKSVKQNPADRTLRTKLAEHYAYLGQWDKALENFAAADGKVGAIAKSERDSDAATEKLADFWWTYPTGKADELVKCFRAHAAKLYEDAIADGKITGLNKVQAERRIEEAKEYGDQNFIESPSAPTGLYCVIDLSGGPNAKKYPVSYLNDVPKGGWRKVHKTTKLVLRKIGSGEDALGRYKISKDYFIGVFEVTQKQWELVMGNNPVRPKANAFPIHNISLSEIRNGTNGVVDVKSFSGRMNQRCSGCLFDLPTQAEWEYAARASSKGGYVMGEDETAFAKTACYLKNSFGGMHEVGEMQPNSFGLYDVHGNVWERCRDVDVKYNGVDPIGRVLLDKCVQRGGGWDSPMKRCSFNAIAGDTSVGPLNGCGFRISFKSLVMSKAEEKR